MPRLFLVAATLLVSACASPVMSEIDAGVPGTNPDGGPPPPRRDFALAPGDDGGRLGDLASSPCPGKNLQSDPANCGACGKVCMLPNVMTNACLGGQCVVGACSRGFYDVNAMGTDGCECRADAAESVGSSRCAGAAGAGTVSDDMPSKIELQGNIVPQDDEDWYFITSADKAEANGGCDKYKLRISFADNPKQQFRFDVIEDDCVTKVTCGGMNEGPTGLTEYEFSANDGPGGGHECPCHNTNKPPKGAHSCSDNSQTLRVRVYRQNGSPLSCDEYKLLVTNGV